MCNEHVKVHHQIEILQKIFLEFFYLIRAFSPANIDGLSTIKIRFSILSLFSIKEKLAIFIEQIFYQN